MYGVDVVKEIRASLEDKDHRLLKEEAARRDLHLKKLIAIILEEHIKQETENGNGK